MAGILDLLDQLEVDLAAVRHEVEGEQYRRLMNASALAAEIRRRLDRDVTGEFEKLKK